jgi:hypothetical protein
MNLLRKIIKENLLLEKRISQISANIEVTFGFDIDRTHHAYVRKTRSDIEGYDEREISNGEISHIILLARHQIAEKIVTGEIFDGEEFVIKSPEKSMAMAIAPRQESGTYWKLYVTTVFRESYSNPFRVGKDQVVIRV